MKKVLTNNIAPGKGQPFGKRSLEHLQAGFNESIAATVEAVNRGRKQVVYLTGCTVASSASQHTNAAGWAYYNGEVFQVLEGVVNSPGAPVWVVEQVYENGGAVPFSNLEFHEVLAIRRLKLAVPGTVGGIELSDAATFGSLLASLPDIGTAISGKADAAQPAKSNPPAGTLGEDYIYYDGLKYFKDTLGFVHFSGLRVIRKANIDALNGTVLFTLPVGLRPMARVNFFGFTATWQKASIWFDVDGVVHLSVDYNEFNASNNDYHLNFDGIYFKTA